MIRHILSDPWEKFIVLHYCDVVCLVCSELAVRTSDEASNFTFHVLKKEYAVALVSILFAWIIDIVLVGHICKQGTQRGVKVDSVIDFEASG